MRRFRMIVGFAALVALAAGLNLLVLKQDAFVASVYFPLILFFLLGLVWIVLLVLTVTRHSRSENKALYGLNTVVSSIVFLAICVVIYAFAQHWDASWDLTQEGRRELSDQTVQVLKTLNKDVTVTCFFMQLDDPLIEIARDKTERFLEQCGRYTDRLKIEFLDPQIAVAQAQSRGITHISPQGTVVLSCGTQMKVITFTGASPRLEERDFTNALVNVIRDAKSKVCFLTGHGERNIDDDNEHSGGSLLKMSLDGEAFSAERIGILITRPEVPADCDILVVNGLGLSGPQSDLHPNEIKAIQEFLDRGGRLLVALDPWVKVSNVPNQTEQFLPWLRQRYGIVVGNDIVVSPTEGWRAELSSDTSLFNDRDESIYEFRGSFNTTHPIMKGRDMKMLFSLTRSVSLADPMPDGVVGSVLLRTTPDFYAETDVATLTQTNKGAKGPDEMAGPVPLAVAVTAQTDDTGQTRDARIVVVGDSDFMSNAQIGVIPGNFNFIMNIMAWLSENEELIAIRPTGEENPPVILSSLDERLIVWVAVLGTVQAVVAAGILMFVLRRSYR